MDSDFARPPDPEEVYTCENCGDEIHGRHTCQCSNCGESYGYGHACYSWLNHRYNGDVGCFIRNVERLTELIMKESKVSREAALSSAFNEFIQK